NVLLREREVRFDPVRIRMRSLTEMHQCRVAERQDKRRKVDRRKRIAFRPLRAHLGVARAAHSCPSPLLLEKPSDWASSCSCECVSALPSASANAGAGALSATGACC